MKLHNGKEVFYMFKNGEKQGDNNSVDYFNRQLCVMCEVKGANTNMFLCACMYGSTILTRIQHYDLNVVFSWELYDLNVVFSWEL